MRVVRPRACIALGLETCRRQGYLLVHLGAVNPETAMCRNIKPLFNFAPPATEAEVRAAALQFVRKISGFNKPSAANEEAFCRAVDEVAAAAERLMGALVTTAQAKDREVEAHKARQRGRVRFAAAG